MPIKTKIKKTDVLPGIAKSYDIGDNKIVICNVNGEFFALEDVCSHDSGELVLGEGKLIETCQLECPRHGARFDVKSGEAKRMPAVAPVKTYRVKVMSDEIEVEVD